MERAYLNERARAGGRLEQCWQPRPRRAPTARAALPRPRPPRLAMERGRFPVTRDYWWTRFARPPASNGVPVRPPCQPQRAPPRVESRYL